MIKIFNKKTNHSILIDETLPQVTFEPKDWHEIPHIVIKLENFKFSHHALSCNDCKAFHDSFGTDTTDWHIEYLDKIKRLNLSTLGKQHSQNNLTWTLSEYFSGSTLKLNIDTDTVESLKQELELKERIEDYESCSKIAIKLNSISS